MPRTEPCHEPRLVGIGVALAVGTFAYILPFGAVVGVLLPARIAAIAPGEKVGLLAVLTGATAAAGLVGNLACGALSDRTRSRLGARVPWLLGGALAAAVLLVPLAGSRGFVPILVWWCLAVVALNAVTTAVTALLAEHAPRARRATLAGAAGVGNLLGVAAGTALGAATLPRPAVGILVVAGLLVALAPAAAAAAVGAGAARGGVAAAATRSTGRRSACPRVREAPDFYRALAVRLCLVLGYFMIHAFQLYVFTDHLGLTDAAAARALTENALVFLAAALATVLVAGPVSDRWRRRRPLVAGGAALFVAGTGVPLVTATPAGMIAFSVLSGLGFGIVYGVDAALMTEVLPRPLDHGRDLGILNVANIGGQLLAPGASAALVGLGLGFGPVFAGAMVASSLGGLVALSIRSVP